MKTWSILLVAQLAACADDFDVVVEDTGEACLVVVEQGVPGSIIVSTNLDGNGCPLLDTVEASCTASMRAGKLVISTVVRWDIHDGGCSRELRYAEMECRSPPLLESELEIWFGDSRRPTTIRPALQVCLESPSE